VRSRKTTPLGRVLAVVAVAVAGEQWRAGCEVHLQR
jgi:type IV secretory pathway VirB2 component (pilin)